MWPDPKTVDNVPLKDQLITAKVCKVIDGDTFKAMIKFGDQHLKLAIRIQGIDTPEIKNPAQHSAALVVRDYVAKLIADQEVTICTRKWDKYGGRVVADVWINGLKQSLATHLIELNFAKPYLGKKKQEWTKDDLECVQNNA